MFKWKTLGLVIRPNPENWWMKSHAMVPTVEMLDEKNCKVYFSGRNELNQSHIGFAIIDLSNPTEVKEISKDPILRPGSLGCFDDNGVTPSCLLNVGNEKLLYYIGWNPGVTTRMHIYGGLAISKDGGKSFERYSRAPILERNIVNPYINTAPFAIADGDSYKMYYVSGVGWVHKDFPRYNIQIAHSKDGKEWKREGKVAIDFVGDEFALARPFVIKENNIYKMFFSSKGESNPFYRMKYAESTNGIDWIRKDDFVGMSVSSAGEDSKMLEYAAVVNYKNKKIMFYNGNNYGANGILVAVEE